MENTAIPKSLSKNTQQLRFFDIAANLSDEKFNGFYFGKKHHQDDLPNVFQRCDQYGVEHLLVTAGYLEDVEICEKLIGTRDDWWTTVGVHPTRASVNLAN